MKRLTIIFGLIGFLGVWLAPLKGEPSSDRDRLIAQSDTGRVLYRMIACERASVAADCHAREQQRLARHIHRQWVNAAAKIYGVTLTPEEEAVVARKTAADESHIEAAAARFQALASAALKIRRGEDRGRVFAELSKHGITAHDLDWELDHLPTIADAERTAAKDFVAEGRQAARDSYARPYIIKHLREIVTKRSLAEHLSFDSAEERFWSEVARATHTRIVDPAFELPDRKGILVSQ